MRMSFRSYIISRIFYSVSGRGGTLLNFQSTSWLLRWACKILASSNRREVTCERSWTKKETSFKPLLQLNNLPNKIFAASSPPSLIDFQLYIFPFTKAMGDNSWKIKSFRLGQQFCCNNVNFFVKWQRLQLIVDLYRNFSYNNILPVSTRANIHNISSQLEKVKIE